MTMRAVSTAVLLALVCSLAACSGQAPSEDAASAETASADTTVPTEPSAESEAPGSSAGRPGVPLTALLQAEPALGSEQLAVLDRLHPPTRVATETQPNRHYPEQTDTLRTYHYDGLTFTVYKVASSGKEILQDLTVTAPGYRTERGLHVGSSRSAVEQVYGPPGRTEGNTVTYLLDGPTEEPLQITYTNGQVAKMHWSFYID